MPASPTTHRKRGFTWRGILVAVLLILAVPAIALSSRSLWPGGSDVEDDDLIHVVQRSRFVNEVTQSGTVESASNVEIRCEVQAKGAQGTTILEIISEGTYVKPGDVLVRLDKSQLENDLVKQQIVCSNSKAALIKAENDFSSAKIAKSEYEEGTYRELEQEILSQISTAEENLRRATDYLAYSQRLAKRGYVTKLQLEADRFAVDKAKTDLNVAQTKIRVLRDFTKAKMLNDLNSAIATAEASMKAAERSHELDLDQLKLLEQQVEKCTVRAPASGQVVYANETNMRGSKEVIVQEGEMVRERQVIIRLPDPKRMQVKARVNESRVSLVMAGQQAAITMDAFPDLRLSGTVEKVNEYPAPTAFFSANIKEYDTIVRIHQSPPGLRPGLTAEVRILVEEIEGALHIPVESVIEHGGKHYCLLPAGSGRCHAREVELGASNDKTVVIRKGLEAGDRIMHQASLFRQQSDLPELTAEQLAAMRVKRHAPKPDGAQPPPGGAKSSGEARSSGEATGPAAQAGRLFAEFDKDHDGRIQINDAPEGMRAPLRAADANRDGALDRAEFNSAAAALGRPHGKPPTGEPRPGASP